MPVMERDLYNVLGVGRSADGDEIKRAYRALALRWHPDRNPNDPVAEARFKAVNEAYRVLSDVEQRARYDRLGPLFTVDGRPPRPDEVSEVVSRMVDNLFGRRRKTRGADLQYTLSVRLEDVVVGVQREIEVPRQVRCTPCGGAGAPAAGRTPCPKCEGTGRSSGMRLLRATCYHCDGRGFLVLQPCATCSGAGVVLHREALRVRVPPGAATGVKLKVGAKGNEPPDAGTTGDLYVLVHVEDHALFRRRGEDVIATVPIGLLEATLGADVEVPTLEGTTIIRVPPGTSDGRVLRLGGRGLPHMKGGARGDLHLELQLEVPEGLDEAERRALRAWAEALPDARFPRRRSFHDAVRARRAAQEAR
jgi:molecular chaperone DnaJ